MILGGVSILRSEVRGSASALVVPPEREIGFGSVVRAGEAKLRERVRRMISNAGELVCEKSFSSPSLLLLL